MACRLPRDLWFLIFEYIPVWPKLLVLRLVCRQWWQVVQCSVTKLPSAWFKPLSKGEQPRLDAPFPEHRLASFPSITAVDLFAHSISETLTIPTRIEKLHLAICRTDILNYGERHHGNLQSRVTTGDCDCRVVQQRHLVQRACSSLRFLSICPSDSHDLCFPALEFRSLTALEILNRAAPRVDVSSLPGRLASQLRWLTIDCEKLPNLNFQFSVLHSLELRNWGEEYSSLGGVLQFMPALKRLTLQLKAVTLFQLEIDVSSRLTDVIITSWRKFNPAMLPKRCPNLISISNFANPSPHLKSLGSYVTCMKELREVSAAEFFQLTETAKCWPQLQTLCFTGRPPEAASLTGVTFVSLQSVSFPAASTDKTHAYCQILGSLVAASPFLTEVEMNLPPIKSDGELDSVKLLLHKFMERGVDQARIHCWLKDEQQAGNSLPLQYFHQLQKGASENHWMRVKLSNDL